MIIKNVKVYTEDKTFENGIRKSWMGKAVMRFRV